ncbi:amidohydrolase family protein [Streptomyces europaeiscabiei]|uniref:amidohydrolase family protein n=2 Tax=Streptomyces TaxID=1883 RepID=UPI002E19ACE9
MDEITAPKGHRRSGSPPRHRHEVCYGLDFFTEMRTLLTLQRSAAFARLNSSSGEQAISPFGTLDALRVATSGGAPSVGMPGRLGMLKAGLPADLIAVDTGRLHLRPRGDAVGTVVDFCSNSDVDVDGTLRKWGEGIIGTDVARTIAEAERCRERVLGAVNTARPTAGRGYTGHAPGLLAPGLGVRLGGE